MPVFTTFSRPVYDLGGATNYRLPPRWARPLISALACSWKGHNLHGHGSADGRWEDDASYTVCTRCAMRQFHGLSSRAEFDTLLKKEWEAMEKALEPDNQAA